MPEGSRHHLSHVAAETIDTFRRPEEQDVSHLIPGIGDGAEMPHSTRIVIETVVELHRLIPVVHAWGIVEAVVTCGLSRFFEIGFRLAMIEVEIGCEPLTRTVIEIVLRIEAVLGIVLFTQIFHPLWLADGVILACHMVRHEVDDDLHACLMGALHQSLEFLHALIDIGGQIGINVVVVGDGVRRACPTLHNCWVLTGDSIGRIIGHGSMTDHTCVPDMAHAHLPDVFQGGGREVIQFTAAVLLNRSILLASGVPIAIKARKNLIDNQFIRRCHELILLC